MKKLLALFLSLAIVLALVGCGDHHTPSTDPTDAQTIPTTDPIENATDGTTEPPHTHEHQISDTIGASCTEGGYTVYACACGDTYQADETEALGHAFGEWITVKEPTETEEGEAKRTCSVCGAEETRVLSKLIPDHTHSYAEEVTKAATCSAEGSVTYTCACGDTYTENTPKTAHDYTDSATAATCTSGGYTTHTCSVCGYAYVDGRTAATEHSWGEWVTTQEPTTTSTGTAERTCSNCGTNETKTLDKLIENHTHSYTEEVTKQPTCTADGVKTFTCACGSSYTENISKLGHDYASSETAPTCTANGYTTHTCTRCGNSYKDTPVSALGHDWNDGVITKEPTCTADGVKTFTCGRCGSTRTETMAKLSHDYTETVTEPTCTEKGYTTYACTRCSYKAKKDYTDPTGHNYTSEVTNPTCTEKGYTTHTCSRCNNSYKDSETPATGHVNTDTKRVEPTCTKDGSLITYCVDCGYQIKVEKIASSGSHSYSTTMRLSDAVAALTAKNNYDYVSYSAYEDWNVNVCSGCGDIDLDSMTFAYSKRGAAEVMLQYINAVRKELGLRTCVLDDTLIEIATVQAEDYKDHVITKYPGMRGWYTDGGTNIRQHFNKYYADAYDWIAEPSYRYIGYGWWWADYESVGGMHGAIVVCTMDELG